MRRVVSLVLILALALFCSQVFWVFPLDDQIFWNVIRVFFHTNHCALLKADNSKLDRLAHRWVEIIGRISIMEFLPWQRKTQITIKTVLIACLRLLEEMDALFHPFTELLLFLLPLGQIPLCKHLVNLDKKLMNFENLNKLKDTLIGKPFVWNYESTTNNSTG